MNEPNKTVKILIAETGWWEGHVEVEKEYEIMSKDQLLSFHPRYILKEKPRGLSSFPDSKFVLFDARNPSKKSGLKDKVYAVSVSDYKAVLASLPHFPNKKEGKRLRKEKSKKSI